MSTQRSGSGKGKGVFRIWVEENQKVIWVVLLIIVAPLFAFTGPVTSFFGSGMKDQVAEEFYGKEIMRSDLVKVEPLLGTALILSNLANSTAMLSDPTTPPPAPIFQGDSLLSDGRGSDEFDIYRYFLYKEKARRMGLRVTDRELSDHIRDLWQWLEASKRAGEEVSKKYADQKKDTKALDQQQFQRQREASELARKMKKDFEQVNAWDPSAWASFVTSIGRRSRSDRPRLRDLEEVVRDLYLIAKLENHVRNGVQVTPDEVYAKYREENRTRLFSWTGFTVSEALKEKVSASLKPEELKLHYDTNREKFEKPFSIRAAWLLLPREHFRAEAEKVVTDSDVLNHYNENRNEYRRPTISSQESNFSVRTQEETAKLAAALYRPFDEVKDDVRKKAIDKRADADMRALSQKLHPRLWPNSPPGSPPPAPPTAGLLEGTSKEFPFLQYGTSGWATLDDAEKVFGKGFSRQVTSWINQIASQRPGQPPMDLRVPPTAIDGAAGLIYYAKPELRQPTVPPLADLKDEVQASAVLARGVELIEKSARAQASEIDAGKKTLEQVAEAGVDVDVGSEASPEKVHIAGSPVQRSPRHLGRYGPLMIPKAKKDGETKPDEAKKDEPAKPEADPEEPEEEAHPSSRQILDGVTRISEKGKTTTVSDAEEGSCYIVRLDEALSPDASNFEDRRPWIESQLLREKQGQHLTQWKVEVLQEARGSTEPAPSGEAKTAPPTP